MRRRLFLRLFSASALGAASPGIRDNTDDAITPEDIAGAEKIAGLTFDPAYREMMVQDLVENIGDYEAVRELHLPNSVQPALVFDPTMAGETPRPEAPMRWNSYVVSRPSSDEDLAFSSVAELSHLLRTRQVTSVELTELFLRRLQRYDPVLQTVVTLTEERALVKAAAADRELDAGQWRGPLHGVPYGAKDLLAVKGYPTTWGAVPYRHQMLDLDAAVVEELDAAGAILVAKLTLGALAWGDVWFGGMTKNPWNVKQGSSGSSAGPGSAVAAGLVPFAIGSETLGSIVSPSTRNGVTGHRPTFGTVSRYGAMTLSWTMDKLGPMARSAEDCALVFDAIRGRDERDPTTVDSGFPYLQNADLRSLRVGYYASAFEEEGENRDADLRSLEVIRSMGIDPVPVELSRDMPVGAILTTLSVEAAAAFDELTRSGVADRMVRQTRNAWPHVFRAARFVPAVEFLQANRARALLMHRTAEALRGIDVFITPSYGGSVLGITNLTGHPCVCVPNDFRPLKDEPTSVRRQPSSISFIGGLYKDAEALMLAHAYQQATDFHRRRPAMG